MSTSSQNFIFMMFFVILRALLQFGEKYGVLRNSGNRTEWSSIRSVIMRVINKIGRPRNGSPICLIASMITELELHDTKSCYQLIKTISKFEKQNNHWLNVFMNKDTTVNFF